MADPTEGRPSLRNFDAYSDRNGQNQGQDDPLDLARPAHLQRALESDPSWQAEVARLASDRSRIDSIAGGSVETVEATEAETPPENLSRIGDATLPRPGDAAPGGSAEGGEGAERGRPAADLAAQSAPGERRPGEDLDARQDQLLDEAVEETFPASDPISPKRITK